MGEKTGQNISEETPDILMGEYFTAIRALEGGVKGNGITTNMNAFSQLSICENDFPHAAMPALTC